MLTNIPQAIQEELDRYLEAHDKLVDGQGSTEILEQVDNIIRAARLRFTDLQYLHDPSFVITPTIEAILKGVQVEIYTILARYLFGTVFLASLAKHELGILNKILEADSPYRGSVYIALNLIDAAYSETIQLTNDMQKSMRGQND